LLPALSPQPAPAPPAAPSRLGQGLFAAGAVALPLGLGAAIGYWVADREVRWLPTMVGALLVLAVLALGAMAAGTYLLGPGAGLRRGRKRFIAFALLAVLATGVRVAVFVAARKSPLTSLSTADFATAFAQDVRLYREYDGGLARIVATLAAREDLFGPGAVPRVLSADEEALVLDAWQDYVDTSLALDQVRRFYEDYYRFDLSRLERERHLKAFLLTFAAEMSLYENTAALIALLDRNPNAAKFLDLERPARHIPAGSVAGAREELAGLSDFGRVVAGKRYLAYLDVMHDASREALAAGAGWLWGEVERHLSDIEASNAAALAGLSIGSDWSPLERHLKLLAYPVTAGVAEWMGDTRVKRIGHELITDDQVAALGAALAPGDVLLERRNWFISNVGLPGFWPHAILYVGPNDLLARTFDADAETRAWLKRETGRDLSFTAFLAERFPRAFAERAGGAGEPPRVVLEAVSEGVVQNTLRDAVGDYLAAMRPRLPAWVKAQAIARALGYLGRPYDFDFDFATDHALVCTELVWRSYRPAGEAPGLSIPTVRVLGRETLPPTDIARLFRDERAKPGPQLEFVYFLEGREHHGDAVVSTEPAFLTTPDRSKWDFGQP
jgi:hypothetical protein